MRREWTYKLMTAEWFRLVLLFVLVLALVVGLGHAWLWWSERAPERPGDDARAGLPVPRDSDGDGAADSEEDDEAMAEFGNHTVGSKWTGLTEFRGGEFTAPLSGVVTYLSFRMQCFNVTETLRVKGAIYRADGTLLAETDKLAFDADLEGWVHLFIPSEDRPVITGGQDYILVVWASEWGAKIAYDDVGDGHYDDDGTIFDGWPDPADFAHENRDYSIYAVYEAGEITCVFGNEVEGPDFIDFQTLQGDEFESCGAGDGLSITAYVSNTSGGWTVAGAGDATYNGTYTEAGVHNGKTYYAKGGPVRYLFWDGVQWCLGVTRDVGLHDYQGTGVSLPGNPWSINPGVGTPPAPTVSGTEGIPHDAKAAIYTALGVLIQATEEIVVPAGWDDWIEFPFPAGSEPAIAALTDYVLLVWSSSADLLLRCETGMVGDGLIEAVPTGYDGWPDPVGLAASDIVYGLFATVLTGYDPPGKSGEIALSYGTADYTKGGLLKFSYGVGLEGALPFSYGTGKGGSLAFSYGIGALGSLPFSYGADGKEGKLRVSYAREAGRQGRHFLSYGTLAEKAGALAFSYAADARAEGKHLFTLAGDAQAGGALPASYGPETFGAHPLTVLLLLEDTLVR